MMEIIDCAQNSDEWMRARMGLPTASAFSSILAKGEGKTRAKYMRQLAGEIITGEPSDNYSNVHTERGHEQEPDARALYSFMTDRDPQIVGFVKNGDKGCSPDSLIDANGGLEIKTALAHIQIDRLERGVLPPEYKAQVQGCIWLCEREWWDFVSYSPKLPLMVVRVPRDDDYIANLSGAVDQFNDELAGLVERVRRYGNKTIGLAA